MFICSILAVNGPSSYTITYVVAIILCILVGTLIGVRVYVVKIQKHEKENGDNPESTPLNEKRTEFASLHDFLSGQPDKINTHDDLKSQVQHLPYNATREIHKNMFEVGDEIGSGTFGKVEIGTLTGLYHANSKTTIAIKSINGPVCKDEIECLFGEIKIMSHVKPHLNLVSMVGCCTSELEEHGQLWLLLELCQYGDLKQYLVENKSMILSGNESDPINNRCLIKWAYDIANGMQYLAENRIMHGDLAARNILMDEDPLQSGCPVAKVADFGLSKRFYDNVKYEKKSRPVAWKWMAFEYLTRNVFTLTSDVWSFEVLLWEIFSFGKNPYGHQDYDEILKKLKNDYRLPCPDEVKNITSWSPEDLFNKLSDVCFVADPLARASFSQVLEIIRKELSSDEIIRYNEMKNMYCVHVDVAYTRRKSLC